MTPAQFRKNLFELINEAVADKDLQMPDILGSLYVIFNNFKLSCEWETVRAVRAKEKEQQDKQEASE